MNQRDFLAKLDKLRFFWMCKSVPKPHGIRSCESKRNEAVNCEFEVKKFSLPEFVSVSNCVSLLPTCRLPKLMLVGLAVSDLFSAAPNIVAAGRRRAEMIKMDESIVRNYVPHNTYSFHSARTGRKVSAGHPRGWLVCKPSNFAASLLLSPSWLR